MKKVFIIAEAGVNHNGSIEQAKKLIDIAKECGVDAVKFQTWKTELLATKNSTQAEYQAKNIGIAQSQFDMLKALELPYSAFIELKAYCDTKNIMFLSTPDEEQSAKFLLDLQSFFKIGSGELTNIPYLKFLAKLKRPLILSTGMATLNEVKIALETLLENGLKKDDITLLHATTMYPTPIDEVNLKAMLSLKEAFGVRVGYSDHTMGIEVPIAAVAMGAEVIEKHFTISRDLCGPDHKASLEPHELKAMVNAIRNIEKALGNGVKKPSKSEEANILVVRKSIVAKKAIKKGEILNENNIITKRSTGGLSALKWEDILGIKASKDYFEDELIKENV